MGIRIPNGIRAQDLPNPVAGVQAQEDTTQAAAQQVSALPPPAPVAPAAQGAQAGAPVSDPAADLIAKYSGDLMAKYGGTPQEQQGPPEAFGKVPTAIADLGIVGKGQLVRRPDGQIGALEPDGKIRELSQDERQSLNYLSKAVQLGGPLLGGILGGVLGSGAGAPNVGAGIGAALGTKVAAGVASPLQQGATGEQVLEPTGVESAIQAASGAAGGALLGAAAGKIGAPQSVAAAQETLAGAQSRAQAAKERAATVAEVEGTATPEQINVGDAAKERVGRLINEGKYGEALRAQQDLQQAAREQAYATKLREFASQFPEGGPTPRTVIQSLIEGNRRDIGALNQEVYKAAGTQRFEANSMEEGFRKALDRRSAFDSSGNLKDLKDLTPGDRKLVQEYQRFTNQAGQGGEVVGSQTPAGPRAMTIQEMDRTIERLRDNANFDSKLGRTPEERTFGRLYHEAVVTRDTAAARAMDYANPETAALLRKARDRYASSIDNLEKWDQALRNDPENFTKALVKKDAPETVRELKSTLDADSFGQVRRQFFENLMADVDATSGKLNSAATERALKAYGKSVIEELYTPEQAKRLQALVNYGKVIERKEFRSAKDAASDPVVKKLASAAAKGFWKDVVGEPLAYIYRVTQRNAVKREYFGGKLGLPTTADAFAAQAGNPQQVLSPEPTIGDLVRNPAFRGAGAATIGALTKALAGQIVGNTGLTPPPPRNPER